VAGKCGAQQQHRHGGAGGFAKPHLEIEQRRKTERFEQKAMPGLGRDVARHRMGERVGAQLCERRHRGGGDEAIEQNRDAPLTRRQRGAQDGGKLAAAKRRRDAQRIAKQRGVPGERLVDCGLLAGKARRIDPGAPPGPARSAATKQRRRNGGRRGGVADAHLADTDEIGVRRNRIRAGRDCRQESRLVQGRRLREIGGGLIERERNDLETCAGKARQLIDGRAARGEVRHHLGGDLGRIGRDPLRGHAMIAGKHQHIDAIEARRAPALPKGEPADEILQAAKAAGRLGERGFTRRDRFGRGGMPCGQVEAGASQFGKGMKLGHDHSGGIGLRMVPANHRSLEDGDARHKLYTWGAGALRGGTIMIDDRLRGIADDLRTCLLFSTRLPIPHSVPAGGADIARASWALPLIGVLIGLLGAAAYWIAFELHLPPLVCAALALVTTLAATGCLHEDGLADAADGLFGGRDRAERLAIMRDSRIGSYAACALIVSLILRTAALAALPGPGAVTLALVASHAGARAMMPGFLRLVPPARADGLAADAGRPPQPRAALAALLGVIAVIAALGTRRGLLALPLLLVLFVAVRRLCVQLIGGQTGDTVGALEQLSEILILLTAAAA
jgi:adenosylcobinamide-GDP ribazoletransferase